jgi:hypothetical protein
MAAPTSVAEALKNPCQWRAVHTGSNCRVPGTTRERLVMAQLSHSAYVRNLTHRFRSFMAIHRKVSALLRCW